MADIFNNIATGIFFVLTAICATDANICSESVPRDDQLCVTIKFPWHFEAVHFCTDRNNVNYVPQCPPTSQKSRFCYDDSRNDTLKIATPWDCCPIISTPNSCKSVTCPPKPYNRKCKTIRVPGKCCPTYFCEEGTPEQCNVIRVKREGCYRNAQMEALNCTAFEDPYGCCSKYQCKEDEKPGECPKPTWPAWFHENEVPPTSPNFQNHHQPQDRSDKESTGFSFKHLVKSAVRTAKKAVHQGVKSFKTYLKSNGGKIGQAVSEYVPTFSVDFGGEQQNQKYRSIHRHDDFATRTLVGARNMFQNLVSKRIKLTQSKIRCIGDSTCPEGFKCCPIFNSGNGVVQGYCLETVGSEGRAPEVVEIDTPSSDSAEEYQSEQGVYIRGHQGDQDKYEPFPSEKEASPVLE